MKLAWFRAHDTRAPVPLDPTAAIIATLGREHQIEVITESSAHHFVWMQFRRPYDLCIFELEDTPAHAFIWPYLMEFGGVALLHSLSYHSQRARLPYRFAPDIGARLIAVPYPGMVEVMQDEFPESHVRYAPLTVPAVERRHDHAVSDVVFGALAIDAVDRIADGIEAARRHGADVRLITASSADQLVAEADVVVALRAGTTAECARLGMAAMAAGRPLITIETAITADWPALDPHSWTPRPPAAAPPAAVTVDGRDEAASVITAVTRLARDQSLRERLSQGGRTWAQAQVSLQVAARAWRALLTEAISLPEAARRAESAGNADGTGETRRILREFGVSVDLF